MNKAMWLLIPWLAACGTDAIGEVEVDARGLEQVWWRDGDAWVELTVEADGWARFEPNGPYAVAAMCTQGGHFGFPTTLVRLAGEGDPTSWAPRCFRTDGGAVVSNASAVAARVYLPHTALAIELEGGAYADTRVLETTGDVVAVANGVQILRGVELSNGGEIVVDPTSASVPLATYDLDVAGAEIDQLYGALTTRDHTDAFFDGAAGVRPSDLETGDQQYLVATSFVDEGEKFAHVDVGPGTDDPGRIELDLSLSVPAISVDASDEVVVTWSPEDPWPHQHLWISQTPSSFWLDVEALPGWTSAEPDRQRRLTVPELPDADGWTLEAGADLYHWDVSLGDQVTPRIERGVFARNW